MAFSIRLFTLMQIGTVPTDPAFPFDAVTAFHSDTYPDPQNFEIRFIP
jgi:hypothetical protein